MQPKIISCCHCLLLAVSVGKVLCTTVSFRHHCWLQLHLLKLLRDIYSLYQHLNALVSKSHIFLLLIACWSKLILWLNLIGNFHMLISFGGSNKFTQPQRLKATQSFYNIKTVLALCPLQKFREKIHTWSFPASRNCSQTVAVVPFHTDFPLFSS